MKPVSTKERTQLVEKIDSCKASMRITRAKLADAEAAGFRGMAIRIEAARRYQEIELQRLAHQLAEMDSRSVSA